MHYLIRDGKKLMHYRPMLAETLPQGIQLGEAPVPKERRSKPARQSHSTVIDWAKQDSARNTRRERTKDIQRVRSFRGRRDDIQPQQQIGDRADCKDRNRQSHVTASRHARQSSFIACLQVADRQRNPEMTKKRQTANVPFMKKILAQKSRSAMKSFAGKPSTKT